MHNILPCDYAITLFNKLLLDVLGVSFLLIYCYFFLESHWIQKQFCSKSIISF